jgi:hypothetical protein
MGLKTGPAYQIGHMIDVYVNFSESEHPADIKQGIQMARQIEALSAQLTAEAIKRRDDIVAALQDDPRIEVPHLKVV